MTQPRIIKNKQSEFNEIDIASIYERGRKEIFFKNCSLQNSSFIKCDISQTKFDIECNLRGAIICPDKSDWSLFELYNPLAGNITQKNSKTFIKPTKEDFDKYAKQLQKKSGIKSLNIFLAEQYEIATNKFVIADLSNFDFSGISMIDQLGGVDSELKEIRKNQYDLTNADLSGTYLSGADFTAVKLNNVNLTGANIEGTRFNDALMKNVKIIQARAARGEFVRTDLTGAEIRETSLKSENFKESLKHGLTTVNFKGAILQDSIIEDNDLDLSWINEPILTKATFTGATGKDVPVLKNAQKEQNLGRVSTFVKNKSKSIAIGALTGITIGACFNRTWNADYVELIYQDLMPILGTFFAVTAPFIEPSISPYVKQGLEITKEGLEMTKQGITRVKQAFKEPEKVKESLLKIGIYSLVGAGIACAILAAPAIAIPAIAPLIATFSQLAFITGAITGAYAGYNDIFYKTQRTSNQSVIENSEQLTINEAEYAVTHKTSRHKSFVEALETQTKPHQTNQMSL